MRGQTVILSHELADFDALASLLGGALLFPQALPVLPRKLKRNVQAFLSLYRNQFPFVEPRHLPRGRVDLAIVVDTRSFNAVKGMGEDTRHLVIDHHSAAEPLPSGWKVWRESLGPHTTGANTTLLVERLIQQNRGLSPFQATLLALGIYEDTGSLLYPSTTHRDIRCAAWLVEQGARLEVMRRFMRFPPTPAQKALSRQLTEDAEHLTVAGQNVVLAVADAPEYDDELSGLAHRLNELFNPDALFVVVRLKDHVQVVARSNTDAINVGLIAGFLGGGGHRRAAAALLEGATLADVKERIGCLLQEHARAPAKVAEIMSRGRPHTLDEGMSVAAAMELMQRYGHEGFPVLQRGVDGRDKLVGILTRREADRTITHRLGALPVHKVMRQGNHTVPEDAPVSVLHGLMIESGWGQIPVVDAAGELVGIVTRTDLLKLWGEERESSPRVPDVSRELGQVLPAGQHRLLWLVGETATAMGHAVYVVGGFVRDLLLGRFDSAGGAGSLDMDLVVEGDAIELAERMQARCGGRVVTHARFGTAKWILDEPGYPVTCPDLPANDTAADQGPLPPHFDFVTARTEFYTEPTVLPTVEQGSIRLDLHRRDFTVNTLAVALTPDRWGDLLDFYGGLSDLQTGVVRVLHSLSFVDDPTRILRAVRYEQRFRFQIEARTQEHLLDAAPLLRRVTSARIRQELDRIFQEETPEDAVFRLDELGILRRIHPALRAGPSFAKRCASLRELMETGRPGEAREGDNGLDQAPVKIRTGQFQLEDTPIERLYWGLLIYDLLPVDNGNGDKTSSLEKELSERLRLRGRTQRLMRELRMVKTRRPQLSDPQQRPSEVVAVLDRAQPAVLLLLSLVEEDALLRRRLNCYEQTWRHVHPALDGRDLMRLGLQPGPEYGQIMRGLRTALLDGEIEAGAPEQRLAESMVRDILEAA
ncbi:MAG: CBS domain-containing protein [Caldilineaceae bacterium SB0661_bin_32]|uniref:CBS domain-containing protein n=1 Tax=Caldilineaceae bacterium SB0661_bin_32 TaxID=2605255 RepID=A0A6B1D193_9CHLR|nr:CBS domain-containing protein [Caldilineaceae bacterium SB0661_bin_32]